MGSLRCTTERRRMLPNKHLYRRDIVTEPSQYPFRVLKQRFSDVNAGFASLNAGADPGGDTIERTEVPPFTHGGEDTRARGVESVPLVLSSSFPGPLPATRASLTP